MSISEILNNTLKGKRIRVFEVKGVIKGGINFHAFFVNDEYISQEGYKEGFEKITITPIITEIVSAGSSYIEYEGNYISITINPTGKKEFHLELEGREELDIVDNTKIICDYGNWITGTTVDEEVEEEDDILNSYIKMDEFDQTLKLLHESTKRADLRHSILFVQRYKTEYLDKKPV